MNAKDTLEEMRKELEKLRVDYEVLQKSHRRLVTKVLTDRADAEHFLGQMVIDRTLLRPTWAKS